jgi:N utilization substance protein A
MAITSANQLELLQTAEAVAREKMIDPDLVIQAMEESLARAAKSRYGSEMDIRVAIDRKTGRATFTRVRTVVEDDAVESYQAQLTVAQAKQYHGRTRRLAIRSSTKCRRSTWAGLPPSRPSR